MRVLLAFVTALALLVSPLVATPLLYVDTPTSVAQTFVIAGGSVGSDVVHIWAFPPSAAPIFVGAGYTANIDVERKQPSGGWSVLAQDLPIGTYPIVVYGHDAAANNFPTQIGANYTVSACHLPTTEYWMFEGPLGETPVQFQVCRK